MKKRTPKIKTPAPESGRKTAPSLGFSPEMLMGQPAIPQAVKRPKRKKK
jgi:hypothetical protein